MDSQLLRETYSEFNQRPCPFEKAILTSQCRCSRAERFRLAEGEGVSCTADWAQARCLAYLDLLRVRARFALQGADPGAALPHAKALRVQVGGLRGLRLALAPATPVEGPILCIDRLLEAAITRYGALEALPYQTIVQQIAAYRGRRSPRARR